MDLLVRIRLSGEQLAGGIYGIVTAMAVIAALASGSTRVKYMAGAAIGTSFALALTHVYSHWIVNSHGTGPHEGWRLLWKEENPTLIGPILMALVMVAAKLLGASNVVAAEISMWVGTIGLFLLGFRISRLSGRTMSRSLLLGLVDASIGAGIVAIKVIAH